jgi:acyl-CoA thioester hydrolase
MELDGFKYFHKIEIQKRINDIDALGHVNNGIQQHYYDLARLSYFENLLKVYLESSHESMVIANINIDFSAPVFYRDNIAIFSKVTRLGNKSLDMYQFIIETHTGEIKSNCKTTLVGYNPVKKESIVLSDTWKQKIDVFEKDITLANHTSSNPSGSLK